MRVLIIGTLAGQLSEACLIATSRGAKVLQADDIDTALAALRSGSGAGTQLALIDAALPISEFIEKLRAEHICLSVVACGMADDTTGAVRAIRAGAKEYLPLPADPELIAAILEAVAEESHQIVYQDPAMHQLLKLADQVANSSASILITGESGTGKELLARYIHRKSRRAEKPFVSVNCAAIPENLLESELFGHEKGAFTGAIARRIGKFEASSGGTLLLDELGEMDFKLQAKLLRVLQEREIDRVGGTKPIQIDIRLISTTNRRLEDEVSSGSFREDLYFRVNVIALRVPPLRERPNDIQALCKHYTRKYSEINGLPERPLSDRARLELSNYRWPGNVRELENTMHRAVLLASGDTIDVDAILLNKSELLQGNTNSSPDINGGGVEEKSEDSGSLVGRTVAQVEQNLIINTLDHCLGNRTHAASILGISIRTLRNKLKQYTSDGLAVPRPGGEAQRAAL